MIKMQVSRTRVIVGDALVKLELSDVRRIEMALSQLISRGDYDQSSETYALYKEFVKLLAEM